MGKTEWTDDEDEEEEGGVAEEAPVATENQAEESQAAQADIPTQSEANENVEISDEPIQEATKTETLQPVEDENSP